MSYSIGQIIYVLSEKTQVVLPGIVCEEINHKTLDGIKTSYRVAIGPANKQRVVDLTTVDGEVYGDLQEVRNVLIGRLTAFVDNLCNTTNERVQQWYGQNNGQKSQPATPNGKLDPSDLINEVDSSPAQPQQQQSVQQPRTVPAHHANAAGRYADPELFSREFVDNDGVVKKIQINVPGFQE
jgi:hypothetical protein